MRLALVRDGVVENVIEAGADFSPEDGLVAIAADQAGPGWRYEAGTLLPPATVAPAPASVSMFQAREALRRTPAPGAGNLLDAVNAYVEAQRAEQPTLALAWEYATQVERDGVFVMSLANVLGLSGTALDDLFRLAATIEA